MVTRARRNMMTKITNQDLYREMGEVHVLLKELKEDMTEVVPRVKSLELFRSYVKGGFAVISGVCIVAFSTLKGIFGA